MSLEIDLQKLVKRVVGRVMAERGLNVAGSERVKGIHVTADRQGEPLRPAAPTSETEPHGRGPALVTAQCLSKTEDGGRYRAPPGAIVTDLARDEAWRRDIRLISDGSPDRATRADGRLRIALGADHGGFALKKTVNEWVREMGHIAIDLGTHDENAVDYPDFARAVAEAVAQGRADFGICVDGAGIGSAMAANKVPGVRAANCWSVAAAKNAREHNFANVLTLGGKLLAQREAYEIVLAFLRTSEGEERHARRVRKITAIEASYARASTHEPRTRLP